MEDILLKKFFEKERWENAIKTGVDKKIDKGELRMLCDPQLRQIMLNYIISNKYNIAPPHQAKIPKDNGDYRIVYVNENIDRIFLSITNDMLFESFPDMIHPSCKSYQKGIGCGKVVQAVSKEIDRLGIDGRVGYSSIISGLRRYYMSNLCFDTKGNLIEQYQSLKQGCAVASFLADTMLYHIDSQINKLPGFYVRYSDDILYVGPEPDKAMYILKTELNKMQMKLNPKKVETLHKDKWFKFLGFTLKSNLISLSKSRIKSFQKEIEKRTIKKKNIRMSDAVRSVNRYLYYGNGEYSWATQVLPIINVDQDINTLNAFVMDCLRACQTEKKKVGGLGCVTDRGDYTILRGKGKNVKANRNKTDENIEGYYTLKCMQNSMLICRPVYETIVRELV